MAVAVVNKKQTGSTASATLTLPAPATAGNILVAFIAVTGSVAAPNGKDNISGETGWTVNATKALNTTSTNSLWVAIKTAVGGETELNPASAGTVQGISYFELSGASTTVDTIVNKDNVASASTVTSNAITTTDAGDIVLACVSDGTSQTGAINAWAGTGPMTNSEPTTGSRVLGGSYIPGTTLSAATFTANWTTAKQIGMLVVAIKPSGATSASRTAADTISVSDSVTVASAHPRAVGDTVSVSESAARQVALPRAVGDTVTVSESAARQVSVPRAVGDTVSVSESTSRKASFSRTAGDTVSVSDSAIGQLTKLVTAGDTVTVSDSASAVVTPGAGAVRASFAAATSDFVAAGVAAGAVAGPVGSGGTVQGVSVTGGHQ